MQWKLGAAIALVVTCPALAEELDQSAVADALAQLDSMMPRPWCNAERLNPTERSICADRDLSRLDALLELVYGRTTARDDDAAQLAWLRSERVVQIILFPVFGLGVTVRQNLVIGLVFTAVSVVRSYLLRRIFESVR